MFFAAGYNTKKCTSDWCPLVVWGESNRPQSGSYTGFRVIPLAERLSDLFLLCLLFFHVVLNQLINDRKSIVTRLLYIAVIQRKIQQF